MDNVVDVCETSGEQTINVKQGRASLAYVVFYTVHEELRAARSFKSFKSAGLMSIWISCLCLGGIILRAVQLVAPVISTPISVRLLGLPQV